MKPLVKVCGIKELNILKELVNLDKIDFLGFIFYENSPRFISDDLICLIIFYFAPHLSGANTI